MIFEHENYRSFLKAVLAEKVRANPSYSLRAMAKQLGFSGSTLSEAINGKANISVAAAHKLAQKLKLNSDESEYLTLLVQIESMKDIEVKASLLERISRLRPKRKQMQDLQVDHFKQIAEWYHSAILELPFIKNFEFTASNAAKILGISKIEAELAIERLERLELLYKDQNGKYVRQEPEIIVKSPESNAALKHFYQQMLEKTKTAIQEQSPKERISGYHTMPFDPKALPEVREAFEDLFTKLNEISKKYPKPTEVYHLATHFFNLTQKEKGR